LRDDRISDMVLFGGHAGCTTPGVGVNRRQEESMQGRAIVAGLLGALVAVGCASQAPGTQPGDMSAAEHRDHARSHERSAEAHEEHYDPNASKPSQSSYGERQLGAEFEYSMSTYNPTREHLGLAGEQREIAHQHSEAAAELERFAEAECGKFPPQSRAACPVLGGVGAAEDVPSGSRLHLAEGASARAVLDHMRCHHAFARMKGYDGMPQCPMYLPDVEMLAAADGTSITITSKDPRTAAEIRRRARAHVHRD
jgi:hypothetical protein